MINVVNEAEISRAKSACSAELSLIFQGLGFTILADDSSILEYLQHYYSGLSDCSQIVAWKQLFLINTQPDFCSANWRPVQRSKASPLGLKESYMDTPRGRWIRKVRTDMAMFQSVDKPLVIGDLNANRSQVVNFINNQFLNHYQQQGYLLGHAAAFDIDGTTTAIAASSGGGKSTLMLRALEAKPVRFLSNDRILFQPDDGDVKVLGLAKHPRVNPGTLINSERLKHILPREEQNRFAHMPANELWDIEQKYDVLISQCYGENKISLSGTLKNLILLDWSLDSSEQTELNPVDIERQPEVLEGLRKSPGPFFQNVDGQFPGSAAQSCEYYAEHLKGVRVFRLTGKADFDRAFELLGSRAIL
ncbi:HprK-related kinase B [Marinobacter sp.]|uniref:HprK-related kinase B n=1 Tax=Marinobacter sp. TaxID=50741 RepID=UPI003569A336